MESRYIYSDVLFPPLKESLYPLGEGGSGRWPLPPKKDIAFHCFMFCAIEIIWAPFFSFV